MTDIIITKRPTRTMSLVDIIVLWERLLGVTPVHSDDNFFDLGGDSLLALQLFHTVERVTGRALPITAIYEATTPTLLSALLNRIGPAPFSPLVQLKLGVGEPLFIAHGIGGNVVELEKLGRLIDTDRPVYAIQAKGVDGTGEPFNRIEDMVDYYLAAIREVQPDGPYFLSGYSFGGLIALELARALRREGQCVALLALIDSFAHPQTFSKIARYIIRFRVAVDAFRTMSFRGAVAYNVARLRGKRVTANELILAKVPTGELSEAARKTYDATFAALMRYWPPRYVGDILFFRPANSIFPVAPARIWRHLVRRLELHHVPGDHESMVREHAAYLAAGLSRALRRAARA